MPRGNFPIKYLGILLTTRILSYNECKSLVEKITARVTYWSIKTLSYVGRLHLVNSVISSIQSYWVLIFVISKKLIKKVVAICRKFLWAGTIGNSNKALVAWKLLCIPKYCRGLNVRNMVIWNKDALLKMLCDISENKDRLWISWIHEYLMKDGSVFDYRVLQQTSWMLKKVISSRDVIAN